jgi:mannose-6-phosphate isomerase
MLSALPLRFEPFFRPMVWGGRKLTRFLGKNLPGDQAFGESWEVSDHPHHGSVLATATGFGMTLRQLMESHASELLGPSAPRSRAFPWLIKFLDAQDWLSVQVHPDESTAQRLSPSEAAKTEAWLVLDAEPRSKIYAGLKPGVGESELRAALAQGTVHACLHQFTPRPGDFIYLPAGTIHAVGGGVLLAEIQQTSDTTYRLFDWNRRDARGNARTLQVEEALASIHWDQGPIQPNSVDAPSERLIASPFFEIDRVDWKDTLALGGTGRLQALVVTAGYGRFANGEFCLAGDVWLLPAALEPMTLHVEAPLAGLLCTLPEGAAS